VSNRVRLCHVFPNFGHGGPEVRTSTLINALEPDFEHIVIALNGNFSGRSRLRTAAPARFVTPPARTVFGLARLLRNQQAELVLTYGWGGTDALLAARLAGISRVVHGEDGFLPDEAFRERPRRRLARRALLRLAATVVVPSRTLCTIARESWRLSPARVSYIPNGVDLARFSIRTPAARAEARRALGISTDETVIGTAGILRVEKNHRRLIRAFADERIRKNTRLLIVGEGPERDALLRLATELGVAPRVLMAGMVEDMPSCYAAMDVFALSSDTEQMPLVLLEAMASGLPAVATAVGDVSTMIGSLNKQFLVPLGDEGRFVEALATLLDDPIRAMVGAENRERCEREFGLDRMVQAYCHLYYTFAASDRAHIPAVRPTSVETR
jgi:glycosyltransferase involved in cell wall biosynthesis